MDVPDISQVVLTLFRRIVRGYFRRHFTAVRLSNTSSLTGLQDPRLILYANHGSWWDPMSCILLAETLMPARQHYAPMDAAVLSRFRFLQKIGIFGVDLTSSRGAARFIRGGLGILALGRVLWITPQGRFADARQRPLGFKPGMAALASRVPGGCTLQPLAIEYVFWNERLPEVLLHFGQPVRVSDDAPEDINKRAQAALQTSMEHLRDLALQRNPSLFRELARGRSGTGGFYSIWEKFRAILRGSRSRDQITPRERAAGKPH